MTTGGADEHVRVRQSEGGVGKTTVALGVAAECAVRGGRVLLIDLDPQASATKVVGIDVDGRTSMADVMLEPDRFALGDAIAATDWGFDLAPSETALASRESRRSTADEFGPPLLPRADQRVMPHLHRRAVPHLGLEHDREAPQPPRVLAAIADEHERRPGQRPAFVVVGRWSVRSRHAPREPNPHRSALQPAAAADTVGWLCKPRFTRPSEGVPTLRYSSQAPEAFPEQRDPRSSGPRPASGKG